MPWLILNGSLDLEGTIIWLFIIFVVPSLVYGIVGWMIMSHKMRHRGAGFLMGFVIGLGGNAGGVGVFQFTDEPAVWLGGFALAAVVLVVIALFLPKGEPDIVPRPIAPPKPDRPDPHQ